MSAHERGGRSDVRVSAACGGDARCSPARAYGHTGARGDDVVHGLAVLEPAPDGGAGGGKPTGVDRDRLPGSRAVAAVVVCHVDLPASARGSSTGGDVAADADERAAAAHAAGRGD